MPSVTEVMQLLTPGGQRITVASQAMSPGPSPGGESWPASPHGPGGGGTGATGGDVAGATGELTVADIDLPAQIADLTDDDLVGLYRDMMLVRRLDEEATSLQRQGELGLWASLRGQEAAQVGSGRALGPQDMAFPSYREHGVAWCRGVDPAAILAIFRGNSLGGWDPAEHGFALYSIVVGAQTLHATGYAMGMARDGSPGAAIVYFGDGASSEGDVNEAFGWASVFRTPLVFFCQNNQWAISEPASRQSRTEIFHRATGFGFPSLRVDGNDVLACLAVTRWALATARAGRGPVLVEAVTYRMGAHTTADDPTRYRSTSELDSWRRRDPIDRLRAHLVAGGLLDEDRERRLAIEADALAHDLRTRCRSMPDPEPASLFDHVQVTDTGLVSVQRSAFTTAPGDGGAPEDAAARRKRDGPYVPGDLDRESGLVTGETRRVSGEAW
ncbi:pyruvate dehydrogenase (acetyl-transferring) E1 component subunit alpha [Frankia sp. AgB32]|uniref:pyruvate dehydrogenase (acetyl-transferring) E1 component subunit alpha n=1 Tax=Frankia sp. AgB32 TaxID=631119 RepID=UPI00201003E6|nr:pyruvate dehydrogenase (acetyl-transferring) E1 component subunit alpha [Frankia sp. AgB32]MCK9894346.1 pyruvate dehydrogenase (acetyl-transferring) E1 component subunit alpha [Frankia sp. AgB32]